MVTELTELLVERHDQCQELAARVKDISRERACLQTVSAVWWGRFVVGQYDNWYSGTHCTTLRESHHCVQAAILGSPDLVLTHQNGTRSATQH